MTSKEKLIKAYKLNIKEVLYCPSCNHVRFVHEEYVTCCPDRKSELVSTDTAKMAEIGFREYCSYGDDLGYPDD
jgi:uncharacterized protein YbaR (Trm112 family)